MGWKEALKGVSSNDAFRLINIKGRDLTQQQKDTLWRYWKENKESSFNMDHWSKPENWVVDKSVKKILDSSLESSKIDNR